MLLSLLLLLTRAAAGVAATCCRCGLQRKLSLQRALSLSDKTWQARFPIAQQVRGCLQQHWVAPQLGAISVYHCHHPGIVSLAHALGPLYVSYLLSVLKLLMTPKSSRRQRNFKLIKLISCAGL